MTPSIWQLLIVLVIVLLLFGRGKIPQLMGDMAKGIKSFKRGMSNEEEDKKDEKNIENNSDSEK
ncbi:MAG: twin-arginine translocase TatA/TatE family subunit [Rickettsiales bacterium]|nr:twin-arginine translocase TatA/TatE family subunit [Rickettsiales bacterium]|tara:strand:- start:634 stop:825 length:192 start_codon:yes stop_codon:yes gene_type:complete